MVHRGNVPLEWSEKNVIVRAPESNPATSAPKRSRGKSPSSEDKPKKVRRRRASTKKPKDGSPKPPTVVQSGFGVASATKSGVPVAVSVSTPSPLKQYRRKTSAGRVKILKSLEEVFSQSPYLLTSFLSFFFSSLPSFLVLTICFYCCNNPVIMKRHNWRNMILRIQPLTSINYCSSRRYRDGWQESCCCCHCWRDCC